MQFDKRAFYNLLRLSYLLDKSLAVKSWQIDDYRSLPLENLFGRLKDLEIIMDESAFHVYADNVDSPEELTEILAGDLVDIESYDRVYLTVFELWRRIVPEKPSISVFCDELDHQISFFDEGEVHAEEMQDVLGYLEEILHENADAGGEPVEVFKVISDGCAHDLENFLYDYIATQIDDENDSYATELLDGFSEFIADPIWFEFLRVRLQALIDSGDDLTLLHDFLDELKERSEVDLHLEVLQFVVYHSESQIFMQLVRKVLGLVQTDVDFDDIVNLCAEYFLHRDHDEEAEVFYALLRHAKMLSPQKITNVEIEALKKILDQQELLIKGEFS